MKLIRQQITSLCLALVMAFGLALPAASPVLAASSGSKSAVCEGIGLTGGSCSNTKSTGKLNSLIATIINILSVIVGIIAVIMIIIGGLRFITSGGDSNNVAAAKNTIMYALIGLIVVVLAQVIVHFVLGKVAGL